MDNIGLNQTSDMSIIVWDARSGEQIGLPVDQHIDWVSSAAFSPDSQYLAYNKDQQLRIVDVAPDHTEKELSADNRRVLYLVYRPDGTQLLTADDKTIRLLGTHSGQVLAEMTDTGGMQTPAFSADGKYIISGQGGNIRIWDAETHLAIGDLTEGSKDIGSLAITDDNRHIVADNLQSDKFTAAGLWPGPAEWPDLLCAKLTQNMNEEQWNEWVDPSIPYDKPCRDLPKAPDQAPG
ncbi:WD domain, G-beta repeat family protein [Rhodococcus sp. MTM3W5.2]|nr:WD domain, G-beta repeat family protein [Rhodococcus sp. MTM3W5.2]